MFLCFFVPFSILSDYLLFGSNHFEVFFNEQTSKKNGFLNSDLASLKYLKHSFALLKNLYESVADIFNSGANHVKR